MTYRLFIDDERFPKDWDNVVIARNSFDAMQIVKNKGVPIEIMFDHDLGGDDTVRNFIKWFANELLDGRFNLPENFTYSVHSQNPIGAEWIKNFMDGLLKEL